MSTIAYLDAGSGSLVVSAIAGGFAAIVVFGKMGWRRFTALFSPSRRRELRAERAEQAAQRASGPGTA